jgi:hypothetical protein
MVQKIGDSLAHLAARRQARGLLAQEGLEFGDKRPGALGADLLSSASVPAAEKLSN